MGRGNEARDRGGGFVGGKPGACLGMEVNRGLGAENCSFWCFYLYFIYICCGRSEKGGGQTRFVKPFGEGAGAEVTEAGGEKGLVEVYRRRGEFCVSMLILKCTCMHAVLSCVGWGKRTVERVGQRLERVDVCSQAFFPVRGHDCNWAGN